MKNKIIINITKVSPKFEDICSACRGSGKLKAMQAAMTYDAGPIRAKDTIVKCPYCKGTGFMR
jgi:DnaJ-class molecular chaperone